MKAVSAKRNLITLNGNLQISYLEIAKQHVYPRKEHLQARKHYSI
jgi:hypothetical protein